MHLTRTRTRLAVAVCAAGLLVAACGGDDDSADTVDEPSEETTASWSIGLTFAIFMFARVGWTLFVRKITASDRSGSTQMDVPVNPVWPNDEAEKRSPAEWRRASRGGRLRGVWVEPPRPSAVNSPATPALMVIERLLRRRTLGDVPAGRRSVCWPTISGCAR